MAISEKTVRAEKQYAVKYGTPYRSRRSIRWVYSYFDTFNEAKFYFLTKVQSLLFGIELDCTVFQLCIYDNTEDEWIVLMETNDFGVSDF